MKKPFPYIVSFLAVLFVLIGSVLTLRVIESENLTIYDNSEHFFSATYFANIDGHWEKTMALIAPHQQYKVQLQNLSFFTPARYQIAIGNQLGKFHCFTELLKPALGEQSYFTHQEGHCQTTRSTSGLSLILF